MKANKERPNVIWIFGDQHRAQALSCNGDSNINTANIDSLYTTGGVNFERAVSGFPLCCPFRGSLLTGIYPHKCVPGHEYQLDPEQDTIADVFNSRGYHTSYYGKWHLDGYNESNGRAAFHIIPPERRGGFQKWVGYENNNAQYDCWVHGGEGDNVFHRRLPGYETDELTNLFIESLKEYAQPDENGEKRPFFSVLSVQPPHDPYVAPAEFMKKYNASNLELRPNVPQIPELTDNWRKELAGAYAMINNLDWNIGRIRETLRNLNLDKNTFIFYFGDHGDMHGSHGMSRKTNPYEESIRIPFVVHNPFAYTYKRRIDAPLNHVDIAPTTLGVCDIEVPEWMEGFDYSHYVRAREAKSDNEPDSAFIQSVIPTGHNDSTDKAWRGVVTRDGWKYVCFEDMEWLLFNLNDDPYEQMNLAHNSKFNKEKKRLNNRLRKWIEDTDDDFSLPEF